MGTKTDRQMKPLDAGCTWYADDMMQHMVGLFSLICDVVPIIWQDFKRFVFSGHLAIASSNFSDCIVAEARPCLTTYLVRDEYPGTDHASRCAHAGWCAFQWRHIRASCASSYLGAPLSAHVPVCFLCILDHISTYCHWAIERHGTWKGEMSGVVTTPASDRCLKKVFFVEH